MLVDMKSQDMQLYKCHPRTDSRALQVDIASKATLITLSEHAHDEDHTRSLQVTHDHYNCQYKELYK